MVVLFINFLHWRCVGDHAAWLSNALRRIDLPLFATHFKSPDASWSTPSSDQTTYLTIQQSSPRHKWPQRGDSRNNRGWTNGLNVPFSNTSVERRSSCPRGNACSLDRASEYQWSVVASRRTISNQQHWREAGGASGHRITDRKRANLGLVLPVSFFFPCWSRGDIYANMVAAVLYISS